MPRLEVTLVKQYKHSLYAGKKMTIYGERRKKVLSLAKGKQAVAMTGANVFYLTDFWGGGAAIVHPDETVIITSPLEVGRAGELGREVRVVGVKTWAEVKREVVKQVGRDEAVVDSDAGLRGLGRFSLKPKLFLEARRVKDEVEVERIERASKGLDRIFEALTKELRPGRTEWEVAAEVMKIATANELTPSGSDSALSPTIVASGPNGALPHSELTARKVRKGDFVVADIFFRYHGYNSDETRTFAVGSATAEMKKELRDCPRGAGERPRHHQRGDGLRGCPHGGGQGPREGRGGEVPEPQRRARRRDRHPRDAADLEGEQVKIADERRGDGRARNLLPGEVRHQD